MKRRWDYSSARPTRARRDWSRPTTMDRGAPERIDRERFRVAGKIEFKISRRALSAKSQLFWSQPIRIRSPALARTLTFASARTASRATKALACLPRCALFKRTFRSVSPEEIFRMVTVNPARALRYENALGQIRPGFGADLIAVPCSGSTDIFEQIIAFDAPVSWSMVNGNM